MFFFFSSEIHQKHSRISFYLTSWLEMKIGIHVFTANDIYIYIYIFPHIPSIFPWFMKDECNYLWGSKAPKLAIGIAGHNPAAIRRPARPRKSPAQVNPGAMVKRGGHSQKKVTCAKTEKSKITIMTIHDIHIVFFLYGNRTNMQPKTKTDL